MPTLQTNFSQQKKKTLQRNCQKPCNLLGWHLFMFSRHLSSNHIFPIVIIELQIKQKKYWKQIVNNFILLDLEFLLP